MNIDKTLNKLYDEKRHMLTIKEAADYLEKAEHEIAYLVELGDIIPFIYKDEYYVPVLEVIAIVEGWLNAKGNKKQNIINLILNWINSIKNSLISFIIGVQKRIPIFR